MVLNPSTINNIIEYVYNNPRCSILKISKKLKMTYPTAFYHVKKLIEQKDIIKYQENKRKSYLLLNPILKNEMDWLYFVRERRKITGKLESPPKLN